MKHSKILTVAVCCAMFFCLWGCNTDREPVETQPTTETQQVPETTISAVQSVADEIRADALGEYRLIRPDDTGEVVVDAAVNLRSAIQQRTGITLELATDFYRKGVPGLEIKDKEILVGATNRPETEIFLRELLAEDYGYGMVNGKLVIAGRTDEGTEQAVSLFREKVVRAYTDGAEMFFAEGAGNVIRADYEVDEMKLCGISIGEYTIAYSAANKNYERALAELLAERITALTGHILPIVKTTELSGDVPVICIGEADIALTEAQKQVCAADEYLLAAGKPEGGQQTVLARGTDSLGNTAAVQALLALLVPAKGTTTVQAEVDAAAPVHFESNILTAMSFNLLVSNANAQRKERVLTMIENYMPDTFGVQEASPDWISYLNQNLKGYYSYVGLGRDGGSSGEHSAVFYAKDKFNLIDSGTFWLSDTPEQVSKVESSSLNRIWSFALLERKSDGARVMHVNTHLDHKSETARVEQADILLKFLTQYPDTAIICTGDFNTPKGSSVYKTMTAGRLTDSSTIARETESEATFHNYGKSSSIIDFCFVTNDRIAVNRYHVCNEPVNGNFASDHHPVYIEYQLIG